MKNAPEMPPKMPLNIENSSLEMQEFYTAAEIADLKLPGVPVTKRGVNKMSDDNNWHSRKNMAGASLVRHRSGRGGGFEYHYALLPGQAQAALIHRARVRAAKKLPPGARKADIDRDALWEFYDRLPNKKKARAKMRLDIILSVLALEKGGTPKNVAVTIIAMKAGVSNRSIYNWFVMTARRDRSDFLPALVPHNVGRIVKAPCDETAWDFIRADYMRPERPTFNSCFRRLEKAAAKHGWQIPSERSLQRWINKISHAQTILSRFGVERWKQECFPAQERDRSVFHALEAVNADGHKFDVFTKWPDGAIGRTMMVAFQDLYSGKILGWRVDRTENKESVRLAFGDMVAEYGIPGHCYLDNGRAFASKWLTGRTPNRYRFKIKDEDPSGIMTDMGVKIHWTLPYAGQSKPIERAFRDMCDDIAKDPRFAGAWTGNHSANKPDNYGEKAIPIAEFIQVVEEGIREHNARAGRRAKCCHGRSFDETFRESYQASPIRKASDAQKRLYLLAAEGVRASSRDGTLKLMDNRYWSDFLLDHKGQNLVVRFDPQNMHAGLHVYRLDGDYLGFGDIQEAAGFNSVEDAQKQARARKQKLKAVRAQIDAEQKMGIADVVGYMASPEPITIPLNSKVVVPIFGKKKSEAVIQKPEVRNQKSEESRARIAALAAEFKQADNVKRLPETAKHRFKKAHVLEGLIEDGQEIGNEDALWLGQYQMSHEYKTQSDMLNEFGEMYLEF